MSEVISRPAPRFRGAPVDIVVDVRSHIEFWLGHLSGAICVPVTHLPEGLAKHSVTPTSRILVYCASGNRSANAAAHLQSAGFHNVVDGGGMAAASREFSPAEN